ncbi:hypothetical protein C5E45_04890 [Nocardia nova]|uniref:DUF6875 domain-containing protein n=1 Tax=Nocardia nova TaxID=37330 RepID=A0A2S6AW74_9NOCA|nr:hypothetical protein [Nocardia nova]PPJ33674.1 hypothetical protein C5E41_03815 [Nocardia nova]PPJ39468.1 hypothetical protein C5E45_04890 [Nocardia nova]
MNATDEFIGQRSGLRPTRLFATDSDTHVDEHPGAAQLRSWTVEYLCQPHPDLGRPGPVCPYTKHAVAGRFLWAAFIGGGEITPDFLTAVVGDMNDLFPLLPPEDEPDSRLKALLSVFPDLTRYDDLEAVQRSQKTEFVRHGLMLGQFYPGCTVAGLHNADFPALDSPLPLLAVRHMTPTDLAFLETRYEWVESYLGIFAPAMPTFLRHYLADKLVKQTREN